MSMRVNLWRSAATTYGCELWRVVIDVEDPHAEDGSV